MQPCCLSIHAYTVIVQVAITEAHKGTHTTTTPAHPCNAVGLHCAGRRGVPLFFGCSWPQACALVTCYRLMFVLGHYRLALDFLVLDSGVVGLALLALGHTVMDTPSLCRLEAQSSAASPYVLIIVLSCSTDSGLTQPLAAAYASHLTHAVCSPHVFKCPWTRLLFLSLTSWSLGQVSLPV
jgi:hypothetical protein